MEGDGEVSALIQRLHNLTGSCANAPRLQEGAVFGQGMWS